MIFEDGLQQRDFVSVHDAVEACRLALTSADAPGHVLNIGSGKSHAVRAVAERTATALGKARVEPEITRRLRVGDIRHCFADITRARRMLGYEPRVGFDQGITELATWLSGQVAVDRVAGAREELATRGLTL